MTRFSLIGSLILGLGVFEVAAGQPVADSLQLTVESVGELEHAVIQGQLRQIAWRADRDDDWDDDDWDDDDWDDDDWDDDDWDDDDWDDDDWDDDDWDDDDWDDDDWDDDDDDD